MTRQQKIEKLIEEKYVYGNLENDVDLIDWLGEEDVGEQVVMYDFYEGGVTYTVADNINEFPKEQSLVGADDEWKNFDDNDLDNFISLIYH